MSVSRSTNLARRRKQYLGLLLLVLSIALGGEAAVRLAGMVDGPIYDADSNIGYIPKASQHGSFLNKNDWVINEHHMGAEAFVPGPDGNILLVGDSVVWGGNPYARGDRLGPQLQRLLRARVWPISAGSWGLQNEVAYLNAEPAVVAAVDTIVIVANSGDFEEPSSWNCTMTHPLRKPPVALWHLAKKYLLHTPCEGTPPALLVARKDPFTMLRAFVLAHPGKRIVVALYPNQSELADIAQLAGRLESAIPGFKAAGVHETLSIARDPRWKPGPDLYRDEVHPTPHGNAVLAEVLADALRKRPS